jgi:hypothetical protein
LSLIFHTLIFVCQQELEKPPPDTLYGLRIHSWVLVLSGKREVPESLFIEPFTGLSHPVDSPNYLGIESVWNHVNYWVNMQDCSEGVKVSNNGAQLVTGLTCKTVQRVLW